MVNEKKANPVEEKARQIHKSGRARLLAGSPILFTGHSHVIADNFMVAVTFTRKSVQQFTEQIAELLTFAKAYDSENFSVANRNFPLYTTIGEACVHGGATQREETFNRVRSSIQETCPSLEELMGAEFIFDFALFNGGSACVVELGSIEKLSQIRNDLMHAYTALGLADAERFLIRDLVNLKIARLRRLPQATTAAALIETIERLQDELAARPLKMTVEKVIMRPKIEFLTDWSA